MVWNSFPSRAKLLEPMCSDRFCSNGDFQSERVKRPRCEGDRVRQSSAAVMDGQGQCSGTMSFYQQRIAWQCVLLLTELLPSAITRSYPLYRMSPVRPHKRSRPHYYILFTKMRTLRQSTLLYRTSRVEVIAST